jgi:F420-0:gamma-glutamyl ligase
MQIIPIKTRIITPEDNIIDVILKGIEDAGIKVKDNDILGVAETPLGTTEGRIVVLSDIEPSEEAVTLARKFEMLPEVAELVIQEADEILSHNQEQHIDGECRS